ncbi:hypothetical protein OHS70_32780 [Streptomyces sp. NBC_00390]|uniref:hypothetical protein n=1 Tax=Streptomyces sp. NBC_00390 TaxID=2975736 RepID=UPI002E234A7D
MSGAAAAVLLGGCSAGAVVFRPQQWGRGFKAQQPARSAPGTVAVLDGPVPMAVPGATQGRSDLHADARSFTAAYRARFGEHRGWYAAEAFDAALFLAEVCARKGSPLAERGAIVRRMAEVGQRGISRTIEYTADKGYNSDALFLFRTVDGEFDFPGSTRKRSHEPAASTESPAARRASAVSATLVAGRTYAGALWGTCGAGRVHGSVLLTS